MVDFIRTTAAVIAMALLFVLVVVSFTHKDSPLRIEIKELNR